MKRKLLAFAQYILIVLAVALWPCGQVSAENFDDSAIKHIVYPAWFKDSPFYDLEDDLNKARSNGKRGLMLLFTTEGCAYCDAFIRKSLGDPGIAASLQKHFDAIGLEIFDDAEMTDPRGTSMSVKHFAERAGAEFSPTLLFIDTTGETVLRIVGYQSPERFKTILDYAAGGHYRTESLREYFSRESAKASSTTAGAGLREDSLFDTPPYQLDRSRIAAQQPLLMIFEEAGCGACDDFHADVLASQDVREMLRHFEVVRFDAADDSTPVVAPDGRRTTPAALYGNFAFTRTPALAFFDAKGNAVLMTDALVLRQRMLNSMRYMLEHAHEKGMTFQRFARSKGLEKQQTGN